jgi:hypothetical protein
VCVFFFYDDGDTSTTLLVLKWKDIKLGHESLPGRAMGRISWVSTSSLD